MASLDWPYASHGLYAPGFSRNRSSNRTLPVALSFFNQSFSYDYTRMFAALTMVVVPGIVIYMIAQEQVQASLSSGAIKG